jgi:uncharacterized protein YdbL (DUF1318 family)
MLVAVSCVTINIYFPAEDVRQAADRIVDEVYGVPGGAGAGGSPTQEAPVGPGSFLQQLFGTRSAYAQQDIDISTPEIRAIRAAMKERGAELAPYLDSGHIGIGQDGLLAVRTLDGLELKERARVSRLVADENADRLRLYAEIARANGFADKADEVQQIFAQSWREKAPAGWYLQQPDGSWQQK